MAYVTRVLRMGEVKCQKWIWRIAGSLKVDLLDEQSVRVERLIFNDAKVHWKYKNYTDHHIE